MSLIKLLKAPSKLFKKGVITFLIIRRHDLGVIDDKLHYITIKQSASIFQLRQKLWHLLDLPDYCEEIIILKTENDYEIPLAQLCKGNEPQHPYIMEVWLPGKQPSYTTVTYETKALKKLSSVEKQDTNKKFLETEYTKSELSCKMSSSSIFFKLHGRKSRDNFVNILLKIQNDLTTLSNKLSDLEKRIDV